MEQIKTTRQKTQWKEKIITIIIWQSRKSPMNILSYNINTSSRSISAGSHVKLATTMATVAPGYLYTGDRKTTWVWIRNAEAVWPKRQDSVEKKKKYNLAIFSLGQKWDGEQLLKPAVWASCSWRRLARMEGIQRCSEKKQNEQRENSSED